MTSQNLAFLTQFGVEFDEILKTGSKILNVQGHYPECIVRVERDSVVFGEVEDGSYYDSGRSLHEYSVTFEDLLDPQKAIDEANEIKRIQEQNRQEIAEANERRTYERLKEKFGDN